MLDSTRWSDSKCDGILQRLFNLNIFLKHSLEVKYSPDMSLTPLRKGNFVKTWSNYFIKMNFFAYI